MPCGLPDHRGGKVSVGQGWARMRQPWDLSVCYLGEEPDVRDFDSKKEELRGDAGM